jgi:hypothetical protein
MIEPPRFHWFRVAALLLAGCVATILAIRYWPGAASYVAPVAEGTTKTQWKIQAEFKPPRSIVVNRPDSTAILSFEMSKIRNPPIPYPVTIRNLSDRSYPVSYKLLAYDSQARRVGEATDNVTIGPKETVLRQLFFSDSLLPNTPKYASFRLIAYIEH